MNCGIGSLEFTHLHYFTYEKNGCVDVRSWVENGTGIEIKTEDGNSMFFCEGSYILFETQNSCIFCN